MKSKVKAANTVRERTELDDEARRARRKRKLSENLFVLSILIYPLILFCIFYVGVNLNSVFMAFQEIDFDGNVAFAGLSNFKSFFDMISGGDVYLKVSLVNSIVMYAVNLVVCMPLYVLFSYILFKRCAGHRVLRGLVMIPQIISGVMMCLIFKKFVDSAFPDICKTIFGMEEFPNLLTDPRYSFGTNIFYMIWVSFSISLIVYPNAMGEISEEIIESAHLDGVHNLFQELRYIILPLIYPTLTTFLITGFAGILTNQGVTVTFYLYDAPYETYNMGYYYFLNVAHVSNFSGYPMLAAGGLIMTLVMAPATLLVKKGLEHFGPVTDY